MVTGLQSIDLRGIASKCLLFCLMAYSFLAITTLHHAFGMTANLPLENLLFLFILLSGSIVFILSVQNLQKGFLPFLIISLPMVLTPLLSSLYNHQMLEVLQDPEYRTMTKMLLVAPWFYFVMNTKDTSDKIVKMLVIFYSILGAYFLYRYLYLLEVREFDLRPLLNIRHGDPNFLATFFSMVIPLSLLLTVKSFRQKKAIQSLTYIVTSLFLVICVFMTQSRMAILALMISLVLLFLTQIKKISKSILIFGTALILVSIFFGSDVVVRFQNLTDKSNVDRVSSFVNGFYVFSESPILGVGMHQGQNFYFDHTSYPHFQSEELPLDIHNAFLKSLADLGALGFLSYLLIFMTPFLSLLKSRDEVEFPYLATSFTALIICLMAVGVTYKDLVFHHLFILIFYLSSLRNQEKL